MAEWVETVVLVVSAEALGRAGTERMIPDKVALVALAVLEEMGVTVAAAAGVRPWELRVHRPLRCPWIVIRRTHLEMAEVVGRAKVRRVKPDAGQILQAARLYTYARRWNLSLS